MTRRPGDGAAAGQTVAMLVILLISLPVLPLVLLVIVAVRVRDRIGRGRLERQLASESASKPAS